MRQCALIILLKRWRSASPSSRACNGFSRDQSMWLLSSSRPSRSLFWPNRGSCKRSNGFRAYRPPNAPDLKRWGCTRRCRTAGLLNSILTETPFLPGCGKHIILSSMLNHLQETKRRSASTWGPTQSAGCAGTGQGHGHAGSHRAYQVGARRREISSVFSFFSLSIGREYRPRLSSSEGRRFKGLPWVSSVQAMFYGPSWVTPSPLNFRLTFWTFQHPQERRLLHHWSARFDTQDSRKSRLFPIPPRYQGKFAFAGREWGAEITANAIYMERHYPVAYLLILPVGFLLTFVLGFYIRAILGRRVELERTVLERTAELLEINARTSHLNDVLLAIRDVSRVINSKKEPLELLNGVCDSLVQTCGYVIVWIGRPEAGSKRVMPVAHSGAGSNCMQHAPITWDDSPTGRGPAGTAIRERRPVVFDDLSKDPRFTLWKDPVTACGAASIASVPLLHHDRLLRCSDRQGRPPTSFQCGGG